MRYLFEILLIFSLEPFNGGKLFSIEVDSTSLEKGKGRVKGMLSIFVQVSWG